MAHVLKVALVDGPPLASMFRSAAVFAVAMVVAAAGGLWLVPHYGAISVLLPVAVVALLAVLVRPLLGVYLLAFAIPMQNVLVLGGEVTSVRALTLLVVAAWLFGRLIRKESWSDILSFSLLVPAAAFVILAVTSVLWAPSFSAYVVFTQTLVGLLGLLVLVIGMVNSWERVEWVIRMFLLGGIGAAAFTFVQFFVQGAQRAGDNVAGGLNHTAMDLVVLIPLGFYLYRGSRQTFWRGVGLAFIVMSPLAISLTFSRTSFIVLPVILAIQLMTLSRAGRKGVAGVALVTAVGATVLYATVPWDRVAPRAESILASAQGSEEDTAALQSTRRRIELWTGAFSVFSEKPLLGSGYGNFAAQLTGDPGRRTSPHNTILGIMAELGIIGIALWVWLHATALHNAWRAAQRVSRYGLRARSAAVQAVFWGLVAYAAYSAAAITQNHKLYWVLLGLVVVMSRLSQADPGPQDGETQERLESDPPTEELRPGHLGAAS